MLPGSSVVIDAQFNVTYIVGFCGADTRVCRLDNRVETRVLVCTGPTGSSQPLEAFNKRAETILGAADTSVRATSEHDPRAPVAVNVSDIGLNRYAVGRSSATDGTSGRL